MKKIVGMKMKLNTGKREDKSGMGKSWMVIIFYLLLSIMSALAITAIDMSAYGGTDQFYNNGKYEDISYGYVTGWEFYSISPEQKNIFLQDTTTRSFRVKTAEWKYVGLENMADTELKGLIRTYCGDSIVSSQRVNLKPGKNQIALSSGKISRITLCIFREQGQTIEIRKVFVSDHIESFDGYRFGVESAVIAGIIFAILLLLDHLFNIHVRIQYLLKKIANGYDKLFTCITDYIPAIRVSEKTAHGVRTGIFVILFIWNFYNSRYGKKVELYWLAAIIYTLACVLIYMVSKPHCRKTNYTVTGYLGVWVLLCIFMCISDFVVPKTYCYTGYIFLLIYGLLFTLYRDPQVCKDIFRDMAYAIQIFGIGFILIGIMSGNVYGVSIGRISVGFTNANAWANFLVLMVVSSIAMVEDMEKVRKWLPRIIIFVIECISAFYLIYLTQSRWALVMAALFFSIWLFRLAKNRRDKNGTKKRLVFLILFLCLSIPIGTTLKWALMQNADETEEVQELALENGTTYTPFLMDVQASESRMMQTMQSVDLNAFTSGRIGIWRSYVREMNLWGHKYLCSIEGQKTSSHNMFMAYFYRYGLLTGVLFMCFWLIGGCKSIQCLILEKCSWFGLLQFGLLAGYCFLAQLDAFEHPWLYAGWTLAYMGIGVFGIERESEKEQ